MPGDSEKVGAGLGSHTTAGNIMHQQATVASAPAQSLAIGTPGISASPLLAEFTPLDGTHANVSAAVPGRSSVEQPLDRLMRAVCIIPFYLICIFTNPNNLSSLI